MTEEQKQESTLADTQRELKVLTENCKKNFETLQTILQDFHTKLVLLYQNYDYLYAKVEGEDESVIQLAN